MVLEDSGYLLCFVYLMDVFMVRLGLDGCSFVLYIMGFGCNVLVLMGIRVMWLCVLWLLIMLIIFFGLCLVWL